MSLTVQSYPDVESIKVVSDKVLNMLKEEALEQGHRDTGKLINSMEYEIIEKGNIIEVMFTYAFYGRFVNDGVPASKVRYAIGIIIDWAKRKGIIKSKKDYGIAYAIRHTHQQVGIPSKGSFKFSRNGRRTGFQDHVIKQIPSMVKPLIEEELIKPLQMFFFDMLKSVKV